MAKLTNNIHNICKNQCKKVKLQHPKREGKLEQVILTTTKTKIGIMSEVTASPAVRTEVPQEPRGRSTPSVPTLEESKIAQRNARFIGRILLDLAQANEAYALRTYNSNHNHRPASPFAPFRALSIPTISILDYMERIATYSGASDSAIVMAMIYIDRLLENNDDFHLHRFNLHRIMITSVLLAAKFHNDTLYSNAYFAQVGGLQTSELNDLELLMLKMLNYELFVNQHVYDQYLYQLNVTYDRFQSEDDEAFSSTSSTTYQQQQSVATWTSDDDDTIMEDANNDHFYHSQ